MAPKGIILKTLTMAASREFVLLLILSMCGTGAPPRCFEVQRGNLSLVGTIISKAYSKSSTLCIAIDLPAFAGLGDRETCSTFLERVSAETCMSVRGGSWTLQPCQPNVDGENVWPNCSCVGSIIILHQGVISLRLSPLLEKKMLDTGHSTQARGLQTVMG